VQIAECLIFSDISKEPPLAASLGEGDRKRSHWKRLSDLSNELPFDFLRHLKLFTCVSPPHLQEWRVVASYVKR